MKKEDFEHEFMPREIVMKLMRDISPENYIEKLKVIDEHFETLKNYHKPEVLEIIKDEQIAFTYSYANQFDQATIYYERVLNKLIPAHAPNIYSMTCFMVIRCFRLVKKYNELKIGQKKF